MTQIHIIDTWQTLEHHTINSSRAIFVKAHLWGSNHVALFKAMIYGMLDIMK